MSFAENCEYSIRLIKKLQSLDVMNSLDFALINKAIYFAKKYHGSQLRKSGEPYYTHPLEVAYLFGEYTGEEERRYYTTDLIATSILHDTIEDTLLTKEMIAKDFNESIASKVDDLTRIKFDKKITAGETVNSLFFQHKKDVLFIKLFDRLHNVRTIDGLKDSKIEKIIKETILYFFPLAIYLNCYKVEKELQQLLNKFIKNHSNIIKENIFMPDLASDQLLLDSLGTQNALIHKRIQ